MLLHKHLLRCAPFLILSACGTFNDDRHGSAAYSNSFSEALSTHLAVLSVGPWSKYVTDLLPGFDLKSPEALQRVVPHTTSFLEYEGNSLSTRAQIGLQNTSVNKTTTKSSGSDAQSTKTRTETVEPGVSPGLSIPSTDLNVSERLSLKPIESFGDPILRYSAAAALLQEVTLLNKYLSDAAIRSGYDAFVVRLQISVLPKKRNQPYDVYTDISFFPSYRSTQIVVTAPAAIEESPKAFDSSSSQSTMTKELRCLLSGNSSQTETVADAKSDSIWVEQKFDGRLPEIVPLLVTDNLESIAGSRSQEQIQAFVAAVGGILANTAISADAERRIERLSEIMGSDLNSVYTLAQLGQNSVRVRLGAARSPYSEYSMISRTHNVTLLVLVPKPSAGITTYRSLEVVSRSFVRDAQTGERLPIFHGRDIVASNQLGDEMIVRSKLGSMQGLWIGSLSFTKTFPFYDDVPRKLLLLTQIAARYDYNYYDACIDEWGWQIDREILWLDLLDLLASSGVNYRQIDLPFSTSHMPEVAIPLPAGSVPSVIKPR